MIRAVPEGIFELDLHGCNSYQAGVLIESRLRRSFGIYRLRVIHGYRTGRVLRDFVFETYRADSRVLRLEPVNAGATDLVLRELVETEEDNAPDDSESGRVSFKSGRERKAARRKK